MVKQGEAKPVDVEPRNMTNVLGRTGMDVVTAPLERIVDFRMIIIRNVCNNLGKTRRWGHLLPVYFISARKTRSVLYNKLQSFVSHGSILLNVIH